MSIELIEPEAKDTEYILVSDKTSEVLASYSGLVVENPLAAAISTAGLIRKAGGEVTIFKATKY